MKITINRRIQTINLLYWHKGNIKILKTEARELRSYILEQVEQQIDYLDINDYREKKLRVTIDVNENWYTKKGLVKKVLSVKPGITGWAQVNGRNAISWKRKFAYDIYYVDHISFLLDIKILFLTLKKVILSEGVNASDDLTMPPFNGSN